MCIAISKSLDVFDLSELLKVFQTKTILTKNMCVVISKSLVSFDVSVLSKTFQTMTI